MERRAIVIVGPTCSGKTSLSIKIASKLKTEIISADSRQIYRHLSIGTAKPESGELNTIPHHFVDYLDPIGLYNVSRYEKEALNVIQKLHSDGRIPVIVGGSGLYIKSIIDGIVDEVETDPEYRAELLKIRNESGNEAIYKLLEETDPRSASKMLPQNWKRVIRALEIFKLSGKYIWQLHDEQRREIDIDFIQYGLRWDREELYNNINSRVDKMIESGLVEEVRSLLENDYTPGMNALNTVGYKEIIAFLNGDYSIDRAIELIKRNTRRYAKRQLTWFNRDKRITWIDINSPDQLDNIAEFIYTNVINNDYS